MWIPPSVVSRNELIHWHCKSPYWNLSGGFLARVLRRRDNAEVERLAKFSPLLALFISRVFPSMGTFNGAFACDLIFSRARTRWPIERIPCCWGCRVLWCWQLRRKRLNNRCWINGLRCPIKWENMAAAIRYFGRLEGRPLLNAAAPELWSLVVEVRLLRGEVCFVLTILSLPFGKTSFIKVNSPTAFALVYHASCWGFLGYVGRVYLEFKQGGLFQHPS